MNSNKTVQTFLQEINVENGNKYKTNVLKKYTDNELIHRLLQMTYDRVKYNYGVGLISIQKLTSNHLNESKMELSNVLDILENEFATRKVTGNKALARLQNIYNSLNGADKSILSRIIDRDLKIGLGKTSINKVFKQLITKPVYMRCDTYSSKTAKNINFPAIVQLKADGTYREFHVLEADVTDAKNVTCQSRSGESYTYSTFFDYMSNMEEGHYFGELTVKCSDYIIEVIEDKMKKSIKKCDCTKIYTDIIEEYKIHSDNNKEYILPRAIGNGLINSSDVPEEDLIIDLWDYVTNDEYAIAAKKDKKNQCTTPYEQRFTKLLSIIDDCENDNIRTIEYRYVSSLGDALNDTSAWMKEGFEGSILKDLNGVFKDGTPNYQLKIKLKISAEMRCTGYKNGTPGTKWEGKIATLLFENDEGTIKGSCYSGLSDERLTKINDNPEKFLNTVFEIEFNDVTKAEGNNFHAFSHSRFIEWRDDKDETDTLEKVFKLKQMAFELS